MGREKNIKGTYRFSKTQYLDDIKLDISPHKKNVFVKFWIKWTKPIKIKSVALDICIYNTFPTETV